VEAQVNDRRANLLRLLPLLAMLPEALPYPPSIRLPRRDPPLPEPEPWPPADYTIGPGPRGPRFAVPVFDREELAAKRAERAQEEIDRKVSRGARPTQPVEPEKAKRRPKAERRARRRKRRQKGKR
jgi:hypothetical protein